MWREMLRLLMKNRTKHKWWDIEILYINTSRNFKLREV